MAAACEVRHLHPLGPGDTRDPVSLLAWALLPPLTEAESRPVAGGIRQIPEYEDYVYGPLPFSEEVTGFLHHEFNYILGRQKDDGSWDSAQPIGKGRTLPEAGGTVGNTILTAMCGYSLRQHAAINPEVHPEAIGRALHIVTGMVLSGKLQPNAGDASWQYIYALRFVVDEYPRTDDPALRKYLEDACRILVRGLHDCQLGTPGRHSVPFSWAKRSNPGLTVADTGEARGVVTACALGSPADEAGIRAGDILLAAGETPEACG